MFWYFKDCSSSSCSVLFLSVCDAPVWPKGWDLNFSGINIQCCVQCTVDPFWVFPKGWPGPWKEGIGKLIFTLYLGKYGENQNIQARMGFPRDGESLISENFQILAEELCKKEVLGHWILVSAWGNKRIASVTQYAFAIEMVASSRARGSSFRISENWYTIEQELSKSRS